MSNQQLLRLITHAGARMDPALSDRDVDRLVSGALNRIRRRRVRRHVLVGGAALTIVIALLSLSHRTGHAPTAVAPKPIPMGEPAPPPLAEDLNVIRLADGSTLTALDSSTEIALVQDRDDRTLATLGRGRGRFSVMPRPTRTFVVHAGDVTVTVMGTVFTVERVADRIGVTVETGTVRVEWKGGAAILRGGGGGWYPPLPAADCEVRRGGAKTNARVPAAKAVSREGPAESAEELWAAADQERLSGHPREGAALLRRVLSEHRTDARAALAAFTLGRVLLIELDQPREAAAAFAEARLLSPQGPLAEDALAREIEALRQAGEWSAAKVRAQDYLRLYPEGRRAAAARATMAASESYRNLQGGR